jgi:hypothetical protein
MRWPAFLMCLALLMGCKSSDSAGQDPCAAPTTCAQCVAEQCPSQWKGFCSDSNYSAYDDCTSSCWSTYRTCYDDCQSQYADCTTPCPGKPCCDACATSKTTCQGKCTGPAIDPARSSCLSDCDAKYPSAAEASLALQQCSTGAYQTCAASCNASVCSP